MRPQRLTREAEEFLDDLAEVLAVPETRYEQAERSYKSLGEWLHRDASTVRRYDPQVYVQGSFRLGTTIRPLNDAEEYDVDSVCELRRLGKTDLTQKELKDLLGAEIKAYHDAQSMTKPVREGRRCWVLDYADGAQFHMDIVPAVPNDAAARRLLEASGHDPRWSATAIAITDRETALYRYLTEDWPRSNPKGYSEWFRSRMAGVLERRKRRIAEGVRASVEDIPDYRVRTPLQAAVMILKRHRDETFQHRSEVRPISVILTTLAGHAYNGEETTGEALGAILYGMDAHIQRVGGRFWIPNPTDPLENFADKWAEHPERAEAFFEWLQRARDEFSYAARITDRKLIADAFGKGVGSSLADRARQRRKPSPATSLLMGAATAPAAPTLAFPNTRRTPTTPQGFG